jgi:hypothetical protein
MVGRVLVLSTRNKNYMDTMNGGGMPSGPGMLARGVRGTGTPPSATVVGRSQVRLTRGREARSAAQSTHPGALVRN